MLQRYWTTWMTGLGLLMAAWSVHAGATAPDAFVRQLSENVIDAVKADRAIQAGDMTRIRELVDSKVVPHVDFERMTATSVGPQWRTATVEQKRRLREEFKTLLIRTYSGALAQVRDQAIEVKSPRAADGSEVLVRSEIKGRGDPIELDYRLEKAIDGWKIYDVNVGGFWIVEAYKGQFAQDLASGGLDALIARLAQKNAALAAAPKS